ncbi:hypothetical protein, partial [Streptomyces tendae]|uniref:hypothetical protein n=2 Tax=Streptomyces TaxID=1883 RepID=UPI001E65322C
VVPASRIAVVASLAVLAGSVCAVRRMVHLRRALDAERAARRLTAGLHEQDLAAFTMRLNAAVCAQSALSQADLVLDSALADVDLEGGSW